MSNTRATGTPGGVAAAADRSATGDTTAVVASVAEAFLQKYDFLLPPDGLGQLIAWPDCNCDEASKDGAAEACSCVQEPSAAKAEAAGRGRYGAASGGGGSDNADPREDAVGKWPAFQSGVMSTKTLDIVQQAFGGIGVDCDNDVQAAVTRFAANYPLMFTGTDIAGLRTGKPTLSPDANIADMFCTNVDAVITGWTRIATHLISRPAAARDPVMLEFFRSLQHAVLNSGYLQPLGRDQDVNAICFAPTTPYFVADNTDFQSIRGVTPSQITSVQPPSYDTDDLLSDGREWCVVVRLPDGRYARIAWETLLTWAHLRARGPHYNPFTLHLLDKNRGELTAVDLMLPNYGTLALFCKLCDLVIPAAREVGIWSVAALCTFAASFPLVGGEIALPPDAAYLALRGQLTLGGGSGGGDASPVPWNVLLYRMHQLRCVHLTTSEK